MNDGIPVRGAWLRYIYPGTLGIDAMRYYCPNSCQPCGEIVDGRIGCTRAPSCRSSGLWPIRRAGNGAAHQRITESIEPLLTDLNERVQRLERA